MDFGGVRTSAFPLIANAFGIHQSGLQPGIKVAAPVAHEPADHRIGNAMRLGAAPGGEGVDTHAEVIGGLLGVRGSWVARASALV